MPRTVEITVVVDERGAVQGIRTIDGEFFDLGKNLDTQSRKVSNFGRLFDVTFGNIAAKALTSFLGLLRQAPRVLTEVAKRTATIADTQSKFNAVFGESAGEVQGFIDEFARLLGLTDQEAQEYLATLGNIAKAQGFTAQEAGELSQRILRLAGDLSSFNGVPTAETLQAIQAALRGEFDPIERFAGGVRAATVAQQALADTGKRTKKELTDQEKVLATLTVITRGAGDAFGDLERTQGSAANRMRRISATARQLTDDFLVGLNPALDRVLDRVDSLNASGSLGSLATNIGEKVGKAIEELLPGIEKNVAALKELQGVLTQITGLDEASKIESDKGFLGIPGLVEDFGGEISTLAKTIDFATNAVQLIGKTPEEQAPIFHRLRVIIGLVKEVKEETEEAARAFDIPFSEAFNPLFGASPPKTQTPDPPRPPEQPKDRLQAERRLQRLILSLMEEGLQKELAQIDHEFNERINLIREKYPQLADELTKQAQDARDRARSELLDTLNEVADDPDDLLQLDDTALVESISRNTDHIVNQFNRRIEAENQAADAAERNAERQIEADERRAEAAESALEAQVQAGIEGVLAAEKASEATIAILRREITALLARTIAAALAPLGPIAPIAGPFVALGIRALFDRLVPAFASGVTDFRGGLALVSEEGPELVSLPSGSNVLTNENTQAVISAAHRDALFACLRSGPPPSTVTNADIATELRRLGDRIAEMETFVRVEDIASGLDSYNRARRRAGIRRGNS